MKFVHIADVHFDIPFTTLETKDLAETRRLEQRNSFKKVIDYIKKQGIPYLFICGDLYENEYIKLSTIDYINKLFETIPDTKIYIVPGNHDPYLKNSYYEKYNSWAKNITIFKEKLEKIEDENVCIYGYGFEDFYMKRFEYEDIEPDKSKINILLTHGTIDGAREDEMLYNPLSLSMLNSIGFDYIALGHIHKKMLDKNIIYPGSLISLGFDELGEHGMIVRRNRYCYKKVKHRICKG